MLENPPICVVGMHRCGTSLAARVLNLLGVDLGREATLFPANPEDNQRGYWEQTPIMRLNDELFTALGGGEWHQPPPTPPDGWERSDAFGQLRERAREVLHDTFAGAGPRWGWKDPRCSLTLPFWQMIVGEISCVVCVRNPLDVAASLERRNPVHTWESAMSLWLQHIECAVRNTDHSSRALFFFDDWFTDPDGQIARMADMLKPPIEDLTSDTRSAIAEFLTPQLYHHRHTESELAVREDVPVEVRELYFALRAGERSRLAD